MHFRNSHPVSADSVIIMALKRPDMQRVQNNVDLRSIMMMHAGLYPEMQIQDMVKLIFQNEFAGDISSAMSRKAFTGCWTNMRR